MLGQLNKKSENFFMNVGIFFLFCLLKYSCEVIWFDRSGKNNAVFPFIYPFFGMNHKKPFVNEIIFSALLQQLTDSNKFLFAAIHFQLLLLRL